MKFLCVKCDSAMALKEVSGPDDSGSLAVVYNCGGCEHEIAMLTNAFETQLVSSLGVKIGPDGGEKKESKCPFSAMLQNQEQTEQIPAQHAKPSETSGAIRWTADANERLEAIPEFVRPMAKMGVEKFAAEKGIDEIDTAVLDQAREFMGM